MTNRKDKGHDETSIWSTSLTRLQTTNRPLPITQPRPTIAPLYVQNTQQPFQQESQRGSKNRTPKRSCHGPTLNAGESRGGQIHRWCKATGGRTFAKCTPRNKEMTRVPQKTHNTKGGTKTQPTTSFSLRRGVAHERTRNSLHGKGTR